MRNIKKQLVQMLRWSQQYTKTDMVYLAKGGGWLTGSKIITVIGGLILATAFANLLPKEAYGTYKYIISAAGIIGAFTLAGMGTAVTQAVARGFDGALTEGTKIKLKWSIGILIAGLGAAGYYYVQGNNTLAIGMGMIAAFYPIRTSFNLYESFLQGKKDFKRASLYNIGLEIFEVTAMIVTLLLTSNVLWVVLVFFATNTLAALFFYFRSLSVYRLSKKTDNEMENYSKHLSAVNIFQAIARHIDKILIWHFLGPVQLAIYAFAELPISKMGTLFGSFQQIAMPKFSEKILSELKATLHRKVLLFALGLTGVSFLFVLAAPYIYNILFPEYLESIKFSQVFSINLILSAGMMYHKVLEAHKLTKWIYTSKIGSNAAKIVSLLILLPLFGIWGAIISLLISQLALVAFSYIGFSSNHEN